MVMEVEAGVMWPQVKEPMEPLGTGRGKDDFSPRDFRGSMFCKQLGFSLLVFRTVRK